MREGVAVRKTVRRVGDPLRNGKPTILICAMNANVRFRLTQINGLIQYLRVPISSKIRVSGKIIFSGTMEGAMKPTEHRPVWAKMRR
jgi:hypothetical protein